MAFVFVCHVSLCGDVAIPPDTEPVKRPVRHGGSGERRGSRDPPRMSVSPRLTSLKHMHTLSPNVIIEEVIEETVDGAEKDEMGM